MTSLIQQGIQKGLIRFEDNNKYIVYVEQNKRRKHTAKQTQAIQNLRQRLQDDTKKRHDFDKKYKALEDQKKDTLKQTLIDDYAEQLKAQRLDYDIFMAIANDIGYDATGKDTKVNELDAIGSALRDFVEDIEAGRA